MKNKEAEAPLTLEQRVANLEQMVDLFSKHTDIHMRSTSDMQKHITYLNEKFDELQRVVQQQNETIAIVLSALPLPHGAEMPSKPGP